MHQLALYSRYIMAYLKSRMEYKFSFFMTVSVQVLSYIFEYLGIWVIMQKFPEIHGWTYYEVMLLVNLNVFSYSLSGLFIRSPMLNLETMVRRGTFDSMLIYPLNPLLHIIFKQFNHNFFGSFIVALAVFGICLGKLGIIWTPVKALWLVIVLVGATLIQFAMMIVAGSMSFWFVKSSAAVNTVIYGVRRFISYPISIYDRWIQVLVTLIIPYAFVNFFPVQLFLDKSNSFLFHPVFQYLTPLVGLGTMVMAYFIWSQGISKYQSTGS